MPGDGPDDEHSDSQECPPPAPLPPPPPPSSPQTEGFWVVCPASWVPRWKRELSRRRRRRGRRSWAVCRACVQGTSTRHSFICSSPLDVRGTSLETYTRHVTMLRMVGAISTSEEA